MSQSIVLFALQTMYKSVIPSYTKIHPIKDIPSSFSCHGYEKGSFLLTEQRKTMKEKKVYTYLYSEVDCKNR